MSPAAGIRRLGFRRWYERQLIESHACFVTCFLCMIVALVCFEGVSLRAGGWTPVLMLGLVFGSGAVGVAALKRYKHLLDRAERIAEHSTCERCAEYGRLEILGAGGRDESPGSSVEPWMRVRCRKCGNQWLIE